MNTEGIIGLSLAIGIPLILLGALFYHGETYGKPIVTTTGYTSNAIGSTISGGSRKTRHRRRNNNKTRKH